MDNATVLEKAADHLDRVGLAKGRHFEDDYDVENSPCCALGAVRFVLNPENPLGWKHEADWFNQGDEIQSLLHKEIAARKSTPFGSVGPWNDAPHRRKGDVVRFLRGVAKKIREEEVK